MSPKTNRKSLCHQPLTSTCPLKRAHSHTRVHKERKKQMLSLGLQALAQSICWAFASSGFYLKHGNKRTGREEETGEEGRAENSLTSRTCLRRTSGLADVTIHTSKLDRKEEKYRKQSRTPRPVGQQSSLPAMGAEGECAHPLCMRETSQSPPTCMHVALRKENRNSILE